MNADFVRVYILIIYNTVYLVIKIIPTEFLKWIADFFKK